MAVVEVRAPEHEGVLDPHPCNSFRRPASGVRTRMSMSCARPAWDRAGSLQKTTSTLWIDRLALAVLRDNHWGASS